eukprot:1331730-Amorphochlora_amoeboformis.AAC.2
METTSERDVQKGTNVGIMLHLRHMQSKICKGEKHARDVKDMRRTCEGHAKGAILQLSGDVGIAMLKFSKFRMRSMQGKSIQCLRCTSGRKTNLTDVRIQELAKGEGRGFRFGCSRPVHGPDSGSGLGNNLERGVRVRTDCEHDERLGQFWG